VLLDPYGGPGRLTNRVWRTAGSYLTPQWLADHGLAVLVVDGRGMDGRGLAWDRLAYQDLVGTLDDQIEALHEAASRFGFLDLSRVALRGSSFGGYLAAAVLRA
jgi:dipeptidyl-peptidase-4